MQNGPAERSSERVRHARRLFGGIARGYDAMGEVLSFGQDRRWRRFLTSVVDVPSGGRVLDVATGTAAVAIDLVRSRRIRVVGLDQSPEMLRGATRSLARRSLEGSVSLVLGRAERLPFPDGSFDAVTFTYLLRYVDDPASTLEELVRVLRPGGLIASLEFGVPTAPVWRAGWHAHTRLGLPLLGAMFSREWYRAGRFLGPSISAWDRSYPLARQLVLWRDAGVESLAVRRMALGAGVVIWGRKRV